MNARLAPQTATQISNVFVPFCASRAAPAWSPLQLADRILTLAQAADRAGRRGAAEHLLTAMYAVLDQPV